MKLPMVVSPATWDLIERLRPDLDVIVDVFDATLASLLPDGADPHAQALRAAMEDRRPGGGRDRLVAAIRTGRHSVFTGGSLRIGLFPIRYHRDVIGVLASSMPVRAAQAGDLEANATSADAIDRRIERIGWTLRATLEADIALWEKLDRAEHRSRWSDGVLRFLAYLQSCGSEAELFAAVVQAAAVWGDFDARIYRRTLDGRYVVDAALPVRGGFNGPDAFEGAQVEGRSAPLHITSIAELEQMGWKGETGEVTLLPIGTAGGHAGWLLAIAGSTDARLSVAFEMLAGTVSVRIERLLLARFERLAGRLRACLASSPANVPATAASLLRALAADLPAGQVRVVAPDPVSGVMRPIASVGVALFGAGGGPVADGLLLSPERLVFPMAVGADAPAWLDLSAPLGAPFTAADAVVAERAAAWFEAWLAGAWRSLATVGVSFTELPLPEVMERTPVDAGERAAANSWS